MADGTQLNPGEGGDLILTDEVGSFKVQVNKAAFGLDGTSTMVSSENPLPVADAAALTALGEIAAALGATITVEGAVSVGEPTVKLAAGTNNIGDVDVLTEPATAADTGALPSVVKVVGGYDGSNVQALITDASGFLQVDINDDPSKAVLEAVKALLETIDTDTGNIATSTGTLDNAIAGSEMQVDVVSGGPLTTAVEALIAGATIFRSLDIDETEEEVKGTAGRLLFYHYANRTAEELFLKFYNATAANVTVGSTTPVLTIPLAKESQGHVAIPKGGWIFSTAISVACVKGVADANAEGPAANGCVINLGYA